MSNLTFSNPYPFGKCNMVQIESFEKEFSVKIPNDYKDYLCQFNGSIPTNTICFLNDGSGETSIHQMYGLHCKEEYKIRIEGNMLIFAHDTFGNEFAIDLNTDANYGVIYFIDIEIESKILISQSFNNFISSLMSKDIYMDNLKTERPDIYERIQKFKENPQI